jgi:putative tricarboxylic transport membrane protein
MGMSDVLPAIALLALSAVAAVGTLHLGYWSDFTPGPAFLPSWAAAAGVLLCALRLVEARRPGGATAVEWPGRVGLLRVALAFAALVALAGLSPVLGMMSSAALFMAFLLIVVQRRRLLPSLATTAITTGLIYVVFVRWLGVRLPAGLTGF